MAITRTAVSAALVATLGLGSACTRDVDLIPRVPVDAGPPGPDACFSTQEPFCVDAATLPPVDAAPGEDAAVDAGPQVDAS